MEQNELQTLVVNALEDMKANDITVMDVSALTSMTNTLVIASGTSDRHVRACANAVSQEAKQAGVKPLGTEGEDSGEWVLVDLGDIIVHVMKPEAREYYDLEKFWTDFSRNGEKESGSENA